MTETKSAAKIVFKPGGNVLVGQGMKRAGIAPPGQAEPVIAEGIDLSGRPKIIFAVGRGKTGKTTFLRWMQEVSNQRGGNALLADIDPTNSSFSLYFEDVQKPEVDDPAGVTSWLGQLIDHCSEHKQSAIIDLGGGDTTLRALATEMPGLSASLEAEGLAPVVLYMAGTQPEDLLPATTLRERGFMPKAQAIIFNEFAVPPGVSRDEAFKRITKSEEYADLTKSAITLFMPRLFAADVIESRTCSFFDARDNKIKQPLGMIDRTRVRAWLDLMGTRFSGISSWLP